MKQKRTGLLSVLLGLLVIAALFASFGLEAGAQDGGTPTPDPEATPNRNSPEVYYSDPAVIEGDAEWILTDRTFASFYPTGFEFTAVATSSAGEIVNATTVWSHAPRQLRRRAAEYDPETGLFHTRWNHDESTPPWVAVTYQWQFTDIDGNTYVSEWFQGEEYYDPDENWTRFESEDIIVFVEDGLPEDTGPQTMDAMAAQRETFRHAWGRVLSNKPRAILFSSRASFGEWRTGTVAQQVIGTTSSDWGGTVQVPSSSGDIVDLAWGTVLHEVGHLYQQEFADPFFPSGSWWTEGNATLFELNQQYDYEQRVRNIATNGNLPVLLQGTGPNPSGTGPDGIGRYGYDVGYTFFKWLVSNYGLDVHRQLVDGSGTRSRNIVLEEVLGIPAEELEREWRLWLGAIGEAPTLIPTPTIRFPPTVTPFQFPTSSDND